MAIEGCKGVQIGEASLNVVAIYFSRVEAVDTAERYRTMIVNRLLMQANLTYESMTHMLSQATIAWFSSFTVIMHICHLSLV